MTRCSAAPGLLRVLETKELFDAVETLAHAPRFAGDRLAILSNGGGFGVLATDRAVEEGCPLATLSPENDRRAGCGPARVLERRQPDRHHRRRVGAALRRCVASDPGG